MFTTRRKLMRYAFSASVGALLPPSMRRAKASGKSLDTDMNVTEFLMEWAELADWREIRGPYPAGAMHNSVMLSMSRKYVQEYFEKHGEVPTGTHHVRYRCGSNPSNDVHSNVCGDTRQYDEYFTYLGGGRLSIRVLPR